MLSVWEAIRGFKQESDLICSTFEITLKAVISIMEATETGRVTV